MYSRRRNPIRNILYLVFFGMLTGIVYFVMDNVDNNHQTVEPIAVIPTSTSAANTLPAIPTPPTALQAEGSQAAKNTAPLPMIYVPAAAVSAPIIPVYIEDDTWNIQNLGENVGHLQGTPWLDQSGNVVLAGHVEMSNGGRGVFASLFDLEAGDTIIIQVNGKTRQYTVREIVRTSPTDLRPLYPTNHNQLTLITCDKYDFFSDEYLERVVVIADLLS